MVTKGTADKTTADKQRLPSPAVQGWVKTQLGAVRWGERLDSPFGEAHVQRLFTIDKTCVLKCHHGAAGHHSELRALTNLRLPLVGWLPELIAASVNPRALLLSDLPGITGDKLTQGGDAELSAHAEAGRFLATLQAVAVSTDDAMPAEEAMARRLAGWLRRGVLTPSLQALATSLVEPSCFVGTRRVLAHRDFQPRNWLLCDGRLRVIDFGHARADLPGVDWAKLASGPWRRRPELRLAFERGFGGGLPERSRSQLRSLCALHGLATATWAALHGDAASQAEGEAILRWCAAQE